MSRRLCGVTTHRLLLPLLALSVALFAGCSAGAPEPGAGRARQTPNSPGSSSTVQAPAACVPVAQATRGTLAGTPTWAQFCPGRKGYTASAEVPSDALTTHLDLLAGLRESPASSADGHPRCNSFGNSRTYRLQVGYADGTVALVTGRTDPGCAGRLRGGADTTVHGPEDLGVFGAAMAAFGQQYADDFAETAVTALPGFRCPSDPSDPDSIDRDGASAALETGYHLGRRSPMLMPLTGVRGIVCTWRPGDARSTVGTLTGDEAERVRIGLHAIAGGMVDCPGMPEEPTVTAVVEDKTGTRRGVTIIRSECSTVIRSDDGYGLGFEWLDR